MPTPLLIAYAPRDHRRADQLRQDLARRGWRPEPFALGARASGALNRAPVVALLPFEPAEYDRVLAATRRMAHYASRFIVVVNPELPVPDWMYRDSVDAVIPLGDGRDYDTFFDDLIRALMPALPRWMDVRVRPTLLQRPAGVAWWSDDLIVADDRYEHVVRLSVDGASLLVPGLSEPHHVTIDRRDVVIANKGANELLAVTVEDDMATEFHSIREANGPLLRPHLGATLAGMALVCDTDHHQVLIQEGRLSRARRGHWTTLNPPDSFQFPCGAHADGAHVWVADTFNHRLVVFERSGTFVGALGRYGDEPGQFRYPVAVYAWRDIVFVADDEGKRLQVYRFTTSLKRQRGKLALELVSPSLASGWIQSPFGLSVNRLNVLAVSDRDASCVWLINLAEALADVGADVT